MLGERTYKYHVCNEIAIIYSCIFICLIGFFVLTIPAFFIVVALFQVQLKLTQTTLFVI